MTTADYYNRNSEAYFDATVNLDLGHLYREFLPLIHPGGRILDAGCGSGRDSAAFKKMGFDVTSIDASEELAQEATRKLGVDVQVLPFEHITFRSEFDGIWASASLLHVARIDLEEILRRFVDALKSEGILYFSFKHGAGEGIVEGRFFLHMDRESIRSILGKFAGLVVLKVWETADMRVDRSVGWINVIAKKTK